MGNQHVNEPEAVQIHRDVGSKLSVGVHWGTFRLCDDPVDQVIDEFPKAVKAAGLNPSEFVLHGLFLHASMSAQPITSPEPLKNNEIKHQQF